MEHMTFVQFITAYNTLFKEGDSLYHSLAKRFGLSDTAFWVLYILKESGNEITQTELCGTLCLSKQTINSALKVLSGAGYISLEVPRGKHRSKYLSLTPAGREFIRGTIDLVFQVEEEAYKGLSEEERRALLSLLRRYLDLLDRAAQPILKSHQEEPVSNADQTL